MKFANAFCHCEPVLRVLIGGYLERRYAKIWRLRFPKILSLADDIGWKCRASDRLAGSELFSDYSVLIKFEYLLARLATLDSLQATSKSGLILRGAKLIGTVESVPE